MKKNKLGRGWHGSSEDHQRAGEKGGIVTAQRHGQDFYKIIGSKGGKNKNNV